MPDGITMQYEEMRAMAADFQRASEESLQTNDRVNARAEQLMAGWEGVAEQAFMQELQSCRQRTARVPEIYAQIAQALYATADRIQQAEEEAVRGIRVTILADNP